MTHWSRSERLAGHGGEPRPGAARAADPATDPASARDPGADPAPDRASEPSARPPAQPDGRATAAGAHADARLTAWARGRVQGVGFRWWVRSQALELGLVGSATNLMDGRVEVIAEGPRAACERLLELLRAPGTPGRVSGVTERWSLPRGGLSGFVER